jgi:hypothetical protein
MSSVPAARICRSTKKAVSKDGLWLLFDNLDDPACSRFDQHGATIHHRIAILTGAILGRYIIVANALFWKNRPNSYIFAILVRGTSLFDNVRMKAGTLINTKNSRYAANDAADYASDDCTDRARRSLTIPRAPLGASRDTLRLGRNGK